MKTFYMHIRDQRPRKPQETHFYEKNIFFKKKIFGTPIPQDCQMSQLYARRSDELLIIKKEISYSR